jgi:hypothetical protein
MAQTDRPLTQLAPLTDQAAKNSVSVRKVYIHAKPHKLRYCSDDRHLHLRREKEIRIQRKGSKGVRYNIVDT